LINKPICVHLYHEKFKDKEREEISYIVPTKFPEVHHVMKTTASPSAYAAQHPAQYAQPQNAYAAADRIGQYTQMPLDQDLPF
jgi:hypothetical protein